jgi:hypothetical protein
MFASVLRQSFRGTCAELCSCPANLAASANSFHGGSFGAQLTDCIDSALILSSPPQFAEANLSTRREAAYVRQQLNQEQIQKKNQSVLLPIRYPTADRRAMNLF